jgi:hypothetical protein
MTIQSPVADWQHSDCDHFFKPHKGTKQHEVNAQQVVRCIFFVCFFRTFTFYEPLMGKPDQPRRAKAKIHRAVIDNTVPGASENTTRKLIKYMVEPCWTHAVHILDTYWAHVMSFFDANTTLLFIVKQSVGFIIFTICAIAVNSVKSVKTVNSVTKFAFALL